MKQDLAFNLQTLPFYKHDGCEQFLKSAKVMKGWMKGPVVFSRLPSIMTGIPSTIKTMGVNKTTIDYLRVFIIEIGSTIRWWKPRVIIYSILGWIFPSVSDWYSGWVVGFLWGHVAILVYIYIHKIMYTVYLISTYLYIHCIRSIDWWHKSCS